MILHDHADHRRQEACAFQSVVVAEHDPTHACRNDEVEWKDGGGDLVEQGARGDAKGPCEFLNDHDCRVPRAPLQIAHIRSVDVRLLGIALLTPAFLFPKPAQISCKAGVYIHAADEA